MNFEYKQVIIVYTMDGDRTSIEFLESDEKFIKGNFIDEEVDIEVEEPEDEDGNLIIKGVTPTSVKKNGIIIINKETITSILYDTTETRLLRQRLDLIESYS